MPEIKTRRDLPYRFVPDEFDATNPVAAAVLYNTLLGRDVSTRQALEDFILDWDELDSMLLTARTAAEFDVSADTTNPEYEARYLQIINEVVPLFEQQGFALKQKVINSPAVNQLGDGYAIFLRNLRAEVELFHEANVALNAQVSALVRQAVKIRGTEQATFRGKTYTISEIAPFLEETDRRTREEAWRARADAQLADKEALVAIYDELYELRQQIAANAGFSTYRDYRFKEMKRFDYTPADCLAFHQAVERRVVPVVMAEWERRRRLLGVETLRPWDVEAQWLDPTVDPEGHPPLRPFDTVDRLKEGCERIFRQVDPQFGDFFRTMIDDNLLDLDSRPGKAFTIYMDTLADKRVPYMFMNAVGTKVDVDSVLHEAGHCFNYFLARHLPLNSYHMPSLEFAEVGSMSMELLARPYLGEFYNDQELRRLRDEQLRAILGGFLFVARIDSFQHWVYTASDHSRAARRARWAELSARFHPAVDWSGLEEYQELGGVGSFGQPFYIIEYGIAQLGAIRIWLNSLVDQSGAVAAYKRALALGGSRALPELFRVAGIPFAFDEPTIAAAVSETAAQIGHSA